MNYITSPLTTSERAAFGRTILFLLVLLLFGSLSSQTYAQGYLPPKAPIDLEISDVTLETLTSYNLSDMPESWWDELADFLDERLNTEGADVESVMAKFIFLGTYYPEKVDFDGSVSELYNIYRFHRDRDYRVMALASLYAIGDDEVMRRIGYHRGPALTFAAWESDELIRRLTAAAVARHFLEGEVEVGEPAVRTGR